MLSRDGAIVVIYIRRRVGAGKRSKGRAALPSPATSLLPPQFDSCQALAEAQSCYAGV